MSKLLLLIALSVISAICLNTIITNACDENQTNMYVTQIIFGDKALWRQSDEKVQMLLNALYLCSEQSNNNGQEKIDYLSERKVLDLPKLSDIKIDTEFLLDCSHIKWDNIYIANPEVQKNRKKVLQNTVNTVFDFGFQNELFGNICNKNDSFSALLYYFHVLADYIADDPFQTETSMNGYRIPAYSGTRCIPLHNNVPSFTEEQKHRTYSYFIYTPLDNMKRAGVAFGLIDSEKLQSRKSLETVEAQLKFRAIKPSGWMNDINYHGITLSDHLYNRCHLIAHSLGGSDEEINLVTCTEFLNQIAMNPYELLIKTYIDNNKQNHVLYRVTPFFNGNNALVSGIQMEAYSLEDSGEGLCFNVYCYNVQPGIHLNYWNGKNELSDITFGNEKAIPFAVHNPSENNPDLFSEIIKHINILFADQIGYSDIYTIMVGKINSIASEARNITGQGGSSAMQYIALNPYKYELVDTLKTNFHYLLEKEDFFKSAFN